MNRKRIILVGGGFGGVKCARVLRRELSPEQVEIILFNRENHLVFSPLLAEAVGSSLNPLDVVVPLRQLLPGVFCRTEEVQQVDLARNEVEYQTDDDDLARMTYDHLVLACGSSANLHIIPGMADHAFPLKNIADAIALRSHVMQQMEKAEVCADPDRRRWHLTFVIVGGGYTGVEVAGEINELVRGSARYFQNFRAEDATVMLVHSRDQILPEIPPELREFARKKLEQAGVEVVVNAAAAQAFPHGLALRDGRFISGATVVCTIGNSPTPLVEQLAVPKKNGRLLTQADMRLHEWNNVWAVGDCALVINHFNGLPSPPTGQFAERQGRQCAQNIIGALAGQPAKPFYFKPIGELCSLGGHSAVAEVFGRKLSGFWAWFAWQSVYLFKLPTWYRRLQIGFDWAMLLLFPRDLSHLRPRETDRVARASYRPGDFIFRPGEPRMDFYIVMRGEVEMERRVPERPDRKAVAVLGPGSFFGEKALTNDAPHISSAQARTPVEVLVMGKHVFDQLSPALAPMREALAQTLDHHDAVRWEEIKA